MPGNETRLFRKKPGFFSRKLLELTADEILKSAVPLLLTGISGKGYEFIFHPLSLILHFFRFHFNAYN